MAPSLGLRLRALLALAVFSISLSAPLLSLGHFAYDDDAACGSVELAESHPGVQLDAARQPLPPEHCALCHWLRAVGGARTSVVTTVVAWLEPSIPAASASVTRSAAPTLPHLPSRAPPVTLG